MVVLEDRTVPPEVVERQKETDGRTDERVDPQPGGRPAQGMEEATHRKVDTVAREEERGVNNGIHWPKYVDFFIISKQKTLQPDPGFLPCVK